MPYNADSRLLTALAEELAVPFMQIARNAELHKDASTQFQAEMGLKLINGYVLGLQAKEQIALQLEPVALSAILYETAEKLAPLARRQGYRLEVDAGGKFGPVSGDRRLLEQAFIILGYELMQAPAEGGSPTMTLATHRSKSGIVAGIFTDNSQISTDAYRRAKILLGTARQTLPSGTPSNGAGFFIADSLMQSLASTFKIARHRKQTGLAATLIPSQQLRLV